MPEIRPLTRDTLRPLAALKVRDDQTTFLASNLMTMAQSVFEPGSEIYGIWECGDPVSLLAIVDMSFPNAELGDDDDPDRNYVWRLMVDQIHQGHGHGRAALEFAKSIAREKGRTKVVISVVDEPGGALPLYEAFSFQKSGRIIDDEVELILRSE